MTKFVKYETSVEALELVIDEEKGNVYASQSATARMCECGETTIRDFIQSRKWSVLEARTQDQSGGKQSRLLNEEQIGECLAKYNPSILAQCFRAGLRVYLYGLAGYEVKPVARVPKNLVEALRFAADAEEARLKAEQEKELAQAQLADAEQDIEALTEVVDELHNFSSIIRIAKYNKVDEKNYTWRKLKSASIKLGVEIKVAPCPRFETKNLYSHDAWRLVYPEAKLPETITLVIRQNEGAK